MSGKSRRASRNRLFQRKALALAIGGSIAFGFAGGAFAQATTGTIYGTVPVASGETIQVVGGAGFNRTITVGPSGRYSITLPVGTYTVSLLQDGKVVQSRTQVSPVAAGAVAVDFTSSSSAANAQTLATVNVTANAIPPIDVTTTNQVTTITAKQLQQLPLQRTAENIALLAPGVTPGGSAVGTGNPTALGTPLLVFGGASVAENAYYMDGMNTTDALTGQGGISLPYGAIEQQQTFTTGYGAKYGRSVGGVINQIGKSGSNEWHFGFRASWQPAKLQSDDVNSYWNNPRYTGALALNPSEAYGQLYQYRKGDSGALTIAGAGPAVGLAGSENIYDAYVSGPIVKDKLFFFLGVEQDNAHSNLIDPNTGNAYNTFYTWHAPKIYAKLNWNINDSNLLTLTTVQNSFKSWGTGYNFDYDTLKTDGFDHLSQTFKNTFRTWVLNYTSYITDNLTLNALLGKTRGEYYTQQPLFPGLTADLANISSSSNQNPAFLPPGSTGISNKQVNSNISRPNHRDSVMNYRLSLDWKLPWDLFGTHDISVGIDNITTRDIDDGTNMTGPGYQWIYGVGDPGTPIIGGCCNNINDPPFVGPPDSNPDGAGGYYVFKNIFINQASVRVVQRAQYLEDNWQITPNFLLNLGIRSDQFTNYNPIGLPYIRLTKPQWQPRIGFSWNVFGDSSMKVFGNAGRYYLALPAAVALRGAGASTFTGQYYTYSGIDPTTGEPTGLTPIPENPISGVSANNEYGETLDPRTVAATNVKAEYSDNFVLGMQKLFHFRDIPLVFDATGIYQKLGRIVDDWDDQQRTCAAGFSEGLTYLTPDACTNYTLGAVLINPGETQTILVHNPSGGLDPVTVSMAQQGFERKPIRKYYALDLSLEHPWDGKWFGKVSYTFAKDYGNTEGPVDSTIGQGGSSVSITEQWDFAQLMEWSYGEQFNSQRHQLKIYGAYALTPEWILAANAFIASGHPKICLGHYGTTENDPLGYGNAYHWCGGQPAPPGSTGHTPWEHQLDLSVQYRPKWADEKLGFTLAVFNVFNNQTPLQFSSGYGTTATPRVTYNRVLGWQSPRFVTFSVAYDW